MLMRIYRLIAGFFLFCSLHTAAQNIGAGQWRSHLPQGDPLNIFFAGPYLYGWTEWGFARYHLENRETEELSKITGFSEVGVSYAAYHEQLNIVVIAYTNSNIDLLLPDGAVYNVPDLINASVNGSKEINRISFYGDYAFFSCGFGVLVYDLKKKESSADYQNSMVDKAHALEVFNSEVFVATEEGMYKAPLPVSGIAINPNLWEQVDSAGYFNMVQAAGVLYVHKDSTVESFDGTVFTELMQGKNFLNMNENDGEVTLTIGTGAYVLTNNPVNFVPLGGTRASLRRGGDWFYASFGYGMMVQRSGGNLDYLSPYGPYRAATGKLVSFDETLYVAGGRIFDEGGVTYTFNGYYTFTKGSWSNSIGRGIPYLDSFYDIHALCVDPSNGDLWLAGLEEGLVRLRGQEVLEFYDETNSPLKLKVTKGITALTMDKDRNLWIGNFESSSPLVVRTSKGVWDSFPNFPSAAGKVLDLVIDKTGQKWMRFSDGLTNSPGIVVYRDNGTIHDKSDDTYKVLSSNAGSGALPDNKVNCIAVDRNGQIWVGTDKGLTVFSSPSNILSTSPSDAKQIVIGTGDNAGYLLGSESIFAILVDGGNRKWIASRSGLWLVSPDGQEILKHFNAENSPLHSNEIRQLGIVEKTGELFIATDKGLISFGSGSSFGGERHGDVKVFPNPVRPGFEGEISISGLPVDAFVKITDIAGNLIYETRANGGTATWDGRSFDGRKASSGVYLIFTGNTDASDTFVSKLLIVN